MSVSKLVLASALAAGTLASVGQAQDTKATKAPKAAPAAPANGPMLQTNEDKASYFIGRQMAAQLKNTPFKVANEALIRGINDELAGTESPLTQEQVEEAMTALEKDITAGFAKKAEADKQFLAANAKKEGVKTTKSGLQYKVLKEGTGATPKATDTVTTHYEGKLVDGTVFDSSHQRGEPATFPVNGVIPGWTEALQLMKVGSKYQLFIPAELAYGNNPRPGGPIYPGAALVFDIELLDTKAGAAPPRRPAAQLEELPE